MLVVVFIRLTQREYNFTMLDMALILWMEVLDLVFCFWAFTMPIIHLLHFFCLSTSEHSWLLVSSFIECWFHWSGGANLIEQTQDCVGHIIANTSKEEDDIYPHITNGITEEHRQNWVYKPYFKNKPFKKRNTHIPLMIIDDIDVLVYDNKMLIIPGEQMQSCVIQWYHHYLQHHGEYCLEPGGDPHSCYALARYDIPHTLLCEVLCPLPERQLMKMEVWTYSAYDSWNSTL